TERVDGSAVSTVTWPGPSQSTLATTVPSRSNSYRMVVSLSPDPLPGVHVAFAWRGGNKNPPGSEGSSGASTGLCGPGRAYVISTRSLRPEMIVRMNMVMTV